MNISDLDLAKLAQAAYTIPPTWSCQDVHACLTKTVDNIYIVSFRGTTKDREDWIRDLEAWPKKHPQMGYVHAGFLIGIELVSAQILKDLKGKKVIFNGHSLGGALAILMAALFILDGNDPSLVTLVTFGAPKVGSYKLKRILNVVTECRQYRHCLDPVTEVPTFFWFYVHQRTLIKLTENGQIITVEDHFMKDYIRALQNGHKN
jgi:hypothetical protein